MTTAQSFMLAVAFGSVVGTFIGNLITIAMWLIQEHREKKNSNDDLNRKK